MAAADRPKLSILIPTYNVAPYIAECLDSIAAQFTDDCEVVVYDDCSTDGTIEVLAGGERFGTRFTLLQGAENRGVSHARNRLVAAARGEFLWFVDSDDKILDGAITAILQSLADHDPDIVFFDYLIWMPDPTPEQVRKDRPQSSFIGKPGLHRGNPEAMFIATMRSGNLHPWSRVFRRSLFDQDMAFPEGRVFEDVEVVPLLVTKARSIVYLPQPFIAYRNRPGSILTGLRLMRETDIMVALRTMRARYEALFGPMGACAMRATTAFAARQLRGIIKKVTRSGLPVAEQKQLLAQALESFTGVHRSGLGHVVASCQREKGMGLAFHICKRMLQAEMVIRRG